MRDLQPTSYSMDKTYIFPTKIRNKTRMPSLTTPIQHSIGSPSHSNQTRKRNKRYPNWKRMNKTVIVCRDMIAHMQNPTDSTTKPLGLISEFDEKLGYKSIFRNQRHFTYQQ